MLILEKNQLQFETVLESVDYGHPGETGVDAFRSVFAARPSAGSVRRSTWKRPRSAACSSRENISVGILLDR